MLQIPYLTPAVLEAGGRIAVDAIVLEFPQFGWLQSIPAEHFTAGLIAEICQLVNQHSGAKPPP